MPLLVEAYHANHAVDAWAVQAGRIVFNTDLDRLLRSARQVHGFTALSVYQKLARILDEEELFPFSCFYDDFGVLLAFKIHKLPSERRSPHHWPQRFRRCIAAVQPWQVIAFLERKYRLCGIGSSGLDKLQATIRLAPLFYGGGHFFQLLSRVSRHHAIASFEVRICEKS